MEEIKKHEIIDVEESNVADEESSAEDSAELSPEMKYIQNIFRKEKINEFLDSLNDDQQKFIYIFSSGFQAGIGHNIVGVYSKEYISSKEFTDELLKQYNIKIKEVSVKDINLSFMLVWQ